MERERLEKLRKKMEKEKAAAAASEKASGDNKVKFSFFIFGGLKSSST